MNRHFYNFIASFNSAAKTGKWKFIVPLRNKFVYKFILFLFKKKLIDDFRFVNNRSVFFDSLQLKLGSSKNKKYCLKLEIRLKHEFVTGIKPVSTPGKYFFKGAQKLLEYSTGGGGAEGIIVCSSSRLKGLCTAEDLVKKNEGGLIVCVVNISRKKW